jgi:hypothetical protein
VVISVYDLFVWPLRVENRRSTGFDVSSSNRVKVKQENDQLLCFLFKDIVHNT